MKRVIFILLVVLLSACGNNPAPDEGQADRLVNGFVKALQAQDYDTAFSMVDQEAFFAAHSRADWQQYFSEMYGALGKVESSRLKNKLNDTRFSGTFFMYEYVNKHENGLSKELITIVHKINTGNAPLKIFSYKVDSSKLQKLNQNW